ncbi:hypothetical protein MT_57049 [Pseudomonas phage phiPto-bp6g]|nr:hypothetical protein MT_57049 [Pseudomonas phage phiPto-bp6g]
MATFIKCSRCNGSGRLAHFGHVHNGVCLKCRGSGKVAKTKRVKTNVDSWQLIWDYSKIEYFQQDQEKAQNALKSFTDANIPAFLMCISVVKIETVIA